MAEKRAVDDTSGKDPVLESRKGVEDIVAAISGMGSKLSASFEKLHATMHQSFGDIKSTLDGFTVEEHEGAVEREDSSSDEAPHEKRAKTSEQGTSQQSGLCSNDSSSKSQQSGATNKQNSQGSGESIEVLSGIATNLKLVQKKGPAVNEQIADIVRGLMREKLSDEVLTETQNRYNRPENCDCLETTKVNHLIWDKLKSETRSADIKFQRVQTNLVKGVIPIVSLIQELVKARERIPNDVLDVEDLLKMATDAIALIGAANFDLNMRRRDNIKLELNDDYKHLCSSTVPFTDSLFGDDTDLSKQLKDLAEATKVSKKIRQDTKSDTRKTSGYRSFKNKHRGFGYKHRDQNSRSNDYKSNLNWKRPSLKSKEEGKRQK